MVATAANVQVGVTGTVNVAPTGTAVPTSTSGALNTAFYDVGYISEDGVTETTGTSTSQIKAWQNGAIVRTVQTEHNYQLKFTMIETNEKSLEVYYGNYTHGAGAADGSVQVTGTQGYRGAWVVHVIDGTDLRRIVIPDGQVTERDDVSYVNGDATAYGVTIDCYPDTSGVKAYHYFAGDGAS